MTIYPCFNVIRPFPSEFNLLHFSPGHRIPPLATSHSHPHFPLPVTPSLLPATPKPQPSHPITHHSRHHHFHFVLATLSAATRLPPPFPSPPGSLATNCITTAAHPRFSPSASVPPTLRRCYSPIPAPSAPYPPPSTRVSPTRWGSCNCGLLSPTVA